MDSTVVLQWATLSVALYPIHHDDSIGLLSQTGHKKGGATREAVLKKWSTSNDRTKTHQSSWTEHSKRTVTFAFTLYLDWYHQTIRPTSGVPRFLLQKVSFRDEFEPVSN